jgi:hypothetical protein
MVNHAVLVWLYCKHKSGDFLEVHKSLFPGNIKYCRKVFGFLFQKEGRTSTLNCEREFEFCCTCNFRTGDCHLELPVQPSYKLLNIFSKVFTYLGNQKLQSL